MEAIVSAPDKTTLPLPTQPGDAPVPDHEGTAIRDPNSERETPLESTVPSFERGAVAPSALGHVRLDAAERPRAIGRAGHYDSTAPERE